MLTPNRFFWVNLTLALLLGAAFLSLFQLKKNTVFYVFKPPLAVHGFVPDFELTECRGRKVRNADLRGEVWVADFIFTRCAGQCPVISAQMQRLSRTLESVRFVSFSVDPGYDRPEVLAEYANRYGADATRWLFLTGDKETLNRLAVAFHMNKIDEPAFHSNYFAAVDREGRIRGFYDANDAQSVRNLIRDVKTLIRGRA
jgi:cytochrome oxidase Cu insertion factor (SCO1/SenC/PrrC family)